MSGVFQWGDFVSIYTVYVDERGFDVVAAFTLLLSSRGDQHSTLRGMWLRFHPRLLGHSSISPYDFGVLVCFSFSVVYRSYGSYSLGECVCVVCVMLCFWCVCVRA
jgi:hypothetical protein